MAKTRQMLNKIASRYIPGARETLDALNCLNYAVEVKDWEYASRALVLLRQAADEFRKKAQDIKHDAMAVLSPVFPKVFSEDGMLIAPIKSITSSEEEENN